MIGNCCSGGRGTQRECYFALCFSGTNSSWLLDLLHDQGRQAWTCSSNCRPQTAVISSFVRVKWRSRSNRAPSTAECRRSSAEASWASHRTHYGSGAASLSSAAMQILSYLWILHYFVANHMSRVLLCRSHHYSAYSIHLLGCKSNVQAC